MVSHRRSTQSGLNLSVRATVLSAAAATAAATLGAATANADPQDAPRTAKERVDRLYTEAEQATQKYDRAGENADRLRGEIGRAQDRAARGQEQVNRMRAVLGSVASEQYRTGGIDPSLALLLSSDPDTYLDRAAVLERLTDLQTAELHELQQVQRGLAQTRTEAARALAELERSRADATRHKRTVQRKLAEARRLLDTLPGADRARFERASRSGRDIGYPALADLGPASRPAPGAPRPPSWRSSRPWAARTSGGQRTGRIRLLRADAVGVRPRRGQPAADLAGPAVRGTHGAALRGPPRRPGGLPRGRQSRRDVRRQRPGDPRPVPRGRGALRPGRHDARLLGHPRLTVPSIG